jgi:hypothetical protein
MLDIKKFDSFIMPAQDYGEWLSYMRFIETYFKEKAISHPICVEIGTHTNRQKQFYQEFLGAEHIGIDICDKYSKPDIVGNSHDTSTVEALKQKLRGRPIHLLYIDGDHSYPAVKRDYETYGGLVSNIIVFHDIGSIHGVKQFWEELMASKNNSPKMTFITFGCWHTPTYQFGIGLIIKTDHRS